MDSLMIRIMPLFREVAAKYTSNESSTIPYDKARQLMESILYVIGGQMDHQNSLVSKISADELKDIYRKGLERKRGLIKTAKKDYEALMKSFCHYENLCLYDTVAQGPPAFFRLYDPQFDALNIFLTLDYPLLNPIEGQQGIDLVSTYIKRISYEQEFLCLYPRDQIIIKLKEWEADYPQHIFNLCRVIYTNALLCQLLEKSSGSLQLTGRDLSAFSQYQTCTQREMTAHLQQAHHQLLKDKKLSPETEDYLCQSLPSIASTFHYALTHNILSQLIAISQNKLPRPDASWHPNPQMPDHHLRRLIVQLQACQTTAEKITLLTTTVQNIDDLSEIIPLTFDPPEFQSIFQLLTPPDLIQIQAKIREKQEENVPLHSWEKACLKHQLTPKQ